MSELSTKNLRAALLQAQRAIKGVAKGSRNEYAKYDYASADDIVSECREVLHAAGLTVFRSYWDMILKDQQWFVVSGFVISHPESGESEDRTVQLPVVHGKTPIDKAALGVLTTSLGYFLRDLLLIPRPDENELDRRDDRTVQSTPERVKGSAGKWTSKTEQVIEQGRQNKSEDEDFEALCLEAGTTLDYVREKASEKTKADLSGPFNQWPANVKVRSRQYVEKLMQEPVI